MLLHTKLLDIMKLLHITSLDITITITGHPNNS